MWGRGVLPAALPAPFSATLSPALSVYLCTNVGPQGLLVVRLPAPFVLHSASLGPATATRVLSAPVPVSAPPTGLDVCFLFIYLVSDFLAVRFSVSSGCARRHSVSTYAAILVLSRIFNGRIPGTVTSTEKEFRGSKMVEEEVEGTLTSSQDQSGITTKL